VLFTNIYASVSLVERKDAMLMSEGTRIELGKRHFEQTERVEGMEGKLQEEEPKGQVEQRKTVVP
jgi:hypothetical protein